MNTYHCVTSVQVISGPEKRSRYSDSLRTGRSGDRIPVGGDIFVQTGPESHLTSYTMGTRSFLGVKRLGRGVEYQPPSSAEVKKRVELHFYSLSGPSWPVLGRTLHYLLIYLFHAAESFLRS